MLLERLSKEGFLFVTTVLGKTSEGNVMAFRGDLILIQGVLHEGVHMPPQLLLYQCAALAHEDKFIFVSGLLADMAQTQNFLDQYKDVLAPEVTLLIFVQNIKEPMQCVVDGFTFHYIPYDDGLIWNDSMELLYIEKSDLKSLSAEDKVVTVYQAAKSHHYKGEQITFDEALTKTFEVKKELSSGPV